MFHWRAAQVFLWPSLFFRWKAVRFEANIDAVEAHALINIQTKHTMKHRLIDLYIVMVVKKQPGFEDSFDTRAARTCAAILFLELSLAVFLLVSFGV